jgi:hypothetical protein
MFRFAAVGIASLVALAGLLAVLGASRVPWVGGGAIADEAEATDGSVPALAPQPALGLIENDTTSPRSEPDGGPSPISLVFPLVGELLNFGGDGGDIIRPRSDPQSFSDPQGDPSPGPNTSPNPSPTATDDPPATQNDDPSPTTEPVPTSEPTPEPTGQPTTDPLPTTEPVPTSEPTPDPTVDPTTDPLPTVEPLPVPTVDPGSLTTDVLDAIDRAV